MKLLTLDTSTEACSAALGIDGEILNRYELAPRRHAELILPMIDQLLAEADISLTQLDGLGFGQGPGSFTGVRLAASVIQGLAFATDLPVAGISSLAALAQGAKKHADTLFTAIDARMHEIYYAIYQINTSGIAELVLDESVAKPEDIKIPGDANYFGVGSGWQTYHDVMEPLFGNQLISFDGDRYPDAADLYVLVEQAFINKQMVAADQVIPVYIRNKVTG